MVLAVVQARTSSSRLPGKILADLGGRPMLARVVERALAARRVDRVVVATSDQPEDDPVPELCASLGVNCHRGSLDDVLDRFYQAASPYRPAAVVRLTGDCPLLDPQVIDRVVEEFQRGGADYVSNTLTPTYPDGLDVEVMSLTALERAWREAELVSQREHVTLYIWQNSDYKGGALFRARNVAHERDLSSLRWTVDEPADLELVRAIYSGLEAAGQEPCLSRVLAFLADHPQVAALNQGFARNEGLAKSLAQDRRASQPCEEPA
jgi:spore coat polysaccharide biosynthesis protein SpsF